MIGCGVEALEAVSVEHAHAGTAGPLDESRVEIDARCHGGVAARPDERHPDLSARRRP